MCAALLSRLLHLKYYLPIVKSRYNGVLGATALWARFMPKARVIASRTVRSPCAILLPLRGDLGGKFTVLG
jgi:hypothetical protein